jgi:hypothetical protein
MFVENVQFPVLGRELESAENMSVALIPTATLLALFYIERMAFLFFNDQPLDVFLYDVKNSQIFAIFRICLLLMPIYYNLVYLMFDSDFRSALSRVYPPQKREPAKGNELNRSDFNIDPKPRRLTHRKGPSLKTKAL